MRIAVLLIAAVLLPTLTCAADAPALTTYTISNDTIYPTVTAESGLATTTVIDVAFSEQVKASIKIISASGITVKSLYTSSSVTNPTPKVWDGTNNSSMRVDNGVYTVLVSATSTETSLSMTDSSKTITVASLGDPTPSEESSDTSDVATDTTASASSGGGPTEYIPIPTLRIVFGGDRVVSSGADTAFTAAVYDGKGNRRDEALVTWSFGDGMKRTGASVFHAYYYPGEYAAVVRATTPDGGDISARFVVTAKEAGVSIASVSSRGISLVNSGTRTLDLSFWRLSAGGQEFTLPEDTQILGGRTVLFPSQITKLPFADSASLLYPSGETAAAYPKAAVASPVPASGGQLSAPQPSFNTVQAVERITSTKENIQSYEKAVSAPRETAAPPVSRGAVLPAAASPALAGDAAADDSRAASIFRSPWTLGFLGIVALAGSAFIFL